MNNYKIKSEKPRYTQKELKEFFTESNAIESVYGPQSLKECLEAWKYISKQKLLVPEDIIKTHGIYMKRLNPQVAGQLRTYPVMIGGHIKKFVSTELLMNRLEKICDLINESIVNKKNFTMKERLDICKEAHIMMEDLHPFGDGNGRLRIIYNWHRMQMDLPLHVIKEEDKWDYYDWFNEIK